MNIPGLEIRQADAAPDGWKEVEDYQVATGLSFWPELVCNVPTKFQKRTGYVDYKSYAPEWAITVADLWLNYYRRMNDTLPTPALYRVMDRGIADPAYANSILVLFNTAENETQRLDILEDLLEGKVG